MTIALGVWLSVLAAAAIADALSDTQRAVAPSGKLRVALDVGNAVLVTPGRQKKGVRGVAVDIAYELGRKLGVPVELLTYEAPTKVLEALKAEAWDVGFLAMHPAQTSDVVFAAPYIDVELTYLVRARWRLHTISDVDVAGVRVAVQEHSAADLFLTNALKHAILFRKPDDQAALKLLEVGAAEAFAGNKEFLLSIVDADVEYRALPGHFATIEYGVAVPVARAANAQYLRESIEQLKASGFVRRAIENARLRGVVVAPPWRP